MRNKNFIIIVIGQIISLFGNAIQRFSMSLYLLEFTGSTAAFANILAISTIPYILFAPIAGRLSDKINRKKIMVYLDLFCSILIGIYALILLRGRDSELIVAIVMFMLSVCYTLYGPAVVSSIPQIVEEDKLTSANGIIKDGVKRTTFGPAIRLSKPSSPARLLISFALPANLSFKAQPINKPSPRIVSKISYFSFN